MVHLDITTCCNYFYIAEVDHRHFQKKQMSIRKILQQIALLFLLVNLVCGLFFKGLQSLGVDPYVLMAGNLIVVVLTIVSFYLLFTGMKSTSTSGFLSTVLSSFMLKLLAAVAIIFMYSKLTPTSMNMPAILISMFLYLIYMFIELKGLLSLTKKK